jgi:PHP family Zn ribbon phosphoesterase
MKLAADFHIHSALSPCADDDMTPNNIVNMACLKKLDIIAITDHNSAANLEAVLNCARGRDILVVPGMEVETMEEVHVLCLFPGLYEALRMQEVVYGALPGLRNQESIFGRQLIFNEHDDIIGCESRLLLTATKLSMDDVFNIVRDMEGAAIPAHVDRGAYSVISNLGMIPENLGIKHVETSKKCNIEEFKKRYPHVCNYKLIKTSDAHSLGNILERGFFIELKERNLKSLMDKLAIN